MDSQKKMRVLIPISMVVWTIWKIVIMLRQQAALWNTNWIFLPWFFFETAIGLPVAIHNSQSTHQQDRSSPALSSIERQGRTTLWWWWRVMGASPGLSPVPPACLSPSPMWMTTHPNFNTIPTSPTSHRLPLQVTWSVAVLGILQTA